MGKQNCTRVEVDESGGEGTCAEPAPLRLTPPPEPSPPPLQLQAPPPPTTTSGRGKGGPLPHRSLIRGHILPEASSRDLVLLIGKTRALQMFSVKD